MRAAVAQLGRAAQLGLGARAVAELADEGVGPLLRDRGDELARVVPHSVRTADNNEQREIRPSPRTSSTGAARPPAAAASRPPERPAGALAGLSREPRAAARRRRGARAGGRHGGLPAGRARPAAAGDLPRRRRVARRLRVAATVHTALDNASALYLRSLSATFEPDDARRASHPAPLPPHEPPDRRRRPRGLPLRRPRPGPPLGAGRGPRRHDDDRVGLRRAPRGRGPRRLSVRRSGAAVVLGALLVVSDEDAPPALQLGRGPAVPGWSSPPRPAARA